MRARAASIARERLQGAGLDLALPYLLLAPAVLIALAVLLYPLWDGVRASLFFYRYGRPLRQVGLDNYLRLWTDAQFLNSLWVTVRFVALLVAIETVLGLALALFCLREFRGLGCCAQRAVIGLVEISVGHAVPP